MQRSIGMKRILVPTDFSDHARAAARLACGLARRKSAEVWLVHGLHLFEAQSLSEDARLRYEGAEIEDAKRRLERERIQLASSAAGQGVELRTAVRRGDPASAIIAFAVEWEADLIALGSKGQEADERLEFGSVAQHVTRHAPCPVLVTRSGQDARRPDHGLFRSPLVAVDYSRFTQPAVALATDVAERGSVIELIHVYHAPDVRDRPNLSRHLGQVRAEEIERLRELARNLDLAPLAVEARAEIGKVAAQLVDYIAHSKTDVVILGAHGRDTSAQLIGTVVDRVVRVSAAPVIVIPEGALAP